MLLDHYSPTAYATLKVDHYFTPGQVSPIIFAQLNTPSRSLSRSVKAHTKLPVVAAYLYLTVISISAVAHCQIRICSNLLAV